MKNELGEYKTPKLEPSTKFIENDVSLDFDILDFWAWNQSDLVENRNRGVLAEYLVKKALNINSNTRLEWDSYDFETENQVKVEVKSSAYIQAWEQNSFSRINFDIAPTKKIQLDNSFSEKKSRQSDVYVFCILKHKEQSSINPMNLNQWEFYLVLTKTLNKELEDQKSMGLSTLKKLEHTQTNFSNLKKEFDKLFYKSEI